MTNRSYVGNLIPALAVLLLTTIPALANGSRRINVAYPASLNGTAIAAGEYKVSWEVQSSEATVSFMQDGRVVATAKGKFMDRNVKYARNSVVFRTKADNSRTIAEIRFAGTKQALVFAD